jgi:hypothetical protein
MEFPTCGIPMHYGTDDEMKCMKPPENLTAQMAEKTNDQLLAMFKHPDDWLPEALDLAKVELQRRGVDTSAIIIGPPPMPAGQPIFFPVSPLKLVVMSTVTFGIYEIYWFYKNWKLIKQRTDSNITPFLRAFFGVIFCYSCLKEIKDVATSRGLSCPSPGLLTTAWIVLTFTWRLPDPYWLVCITAPLMLIQIQKVVNNLNTVVAPNHNLNARFSAWNIAGIVFGAIWWTLVFIGTFFPQSQ